MTGQRELTTFLPGLGGFHGARWDKLFPFARATRADRLAREEGGAGLDAADFGEILREASEASRFFTSLAERFCRRYDAETSRWLGSSGRSEIGSSPTTASFPISTPPSSNGSLNPSNVGAGSTCSPASSIPRSTSGCTPT